MAASLAEVMVINHWRTYRLYPTGYAGSYTGSDGATYPVEAYVTLVDIQ